jgi:hypothetical protein
VGICDSPVDGEAVVGVTEGGEFGVCLLLLDGVVRTSWGCFRTFRRDSTTLA